ALATRERFAARTDVFTQGAESDSFLVLVSGAVDIIAHTSRGTDRLLAHLGPGAVVGETSLLTRAAHSATARTTEPTEALRFLYAELDRMREGNSLAAYRVIYNMARVLAARLRAADVDLAELCDDARSAVGEDDLE